MPSRRNFINGTLAAGASLLPLAEASGGASAQQPPRRQIVDAQVHLWKAETPEWKWVPGMKPQLPEPMTIERLLPLMDEAGVDRVVVVPPSWPGDRNDYGLEAAQHYPNRFHVMGRIPLQNPQSAALLPKWREQPGMLGVRLTFNNATNIPWITDGTADWLWPAAEKAKVPIYFFAPYNISKFGPIAERNPQLTLIADHMCLTGAMAKDGKLKEAVDQCVALARYPNVSVKMSGSPGVSLEPYPYRDVADHLHRVFDAYGPQRAYWGTDLTNSFTKGTYRQRVTHFTEELPFLSESDKDWVMGRAVLARLQWS
jgi:predicted TIM-barrel fold metal-dependent hydrolase